MARIQLAKTASRKAFLANKRKFEARLQMLQTTQRDANEDSYNDEDTFQLQHHHLLACLERTTVRFIWPTF